MQPHIIRISPKFLESRPIFPCRRGELGWRVPYRSETRLPGFIEAGSNRFSASKVGTYGACPAPQADRLAGFFDEAL